jgi:hypothetical protein
MDNKPAIALSLGIALSALLLFHNAADRLPLGALLPEPVPHGACTSSYFGNQCGERDIATIMAASGDRAFAGRGIEAPVNYAGVRADAGSDRAAIVGRRIDADVVCLTGSADLVRSAQFELNQGDRARISGIIERRGGRTLYLSECTYWRDG